MGKEGGKERGGKEKPLVLGAKISTEVNPKITPLKPKEEKGLKKCLLEGEKPMNRKIHSHVHDNCSYR
jgi:hypothetical protein